MATSLEDRFWPKVRVGAPNECWEWRAAKDGHGYGAIGATGGRRTLQAHRVAYEIANGPIPDGLHILHSCDNPGCVNAAHLSLGTHRENMCDMAAKGRYFSPLTGQRAKLNESDVRSIRASNERSRDIAARFGVTPSAIRQIRRRVIWAAVV